MTAWEMIDLHGILSLAASEPQAFAPEAFEGLAHLTAPQFPGGANIYRLVMQAWPLQLDKGVEYPRWLTVDNDYCTPLGVCLTEPESALLRAILLTCARLRQEDKLMALAGLAEATEQFPLMLAWQRRDALRHVQKELRCYCKLHKVELVSSPPEDEAAWSVTYRKIKQRAARNKKAGGTSP